MFSFFWGFIGFLAGMVITAVFIPARRKLPSIPTLNEKEVHHTDVGCVKFIHREVECSGKEVPMNVIASQHK